MNNCLPPLERRHGIKGMEVLRNIRSSIILVIVSSSVSIVLALGILFALGTGPRNEYALLAIGIFAAAFLFDIVWIIMIRKRITSSKESSTK